MSSSTSDILYPASVLTGFFGVVGTAGAFGVFGVFGFGTGFGVAVQAISSENWNIVLDLAYTI